MQNLALLQKHKNTLLKSLIISLILHLIAVGGIFFLLQNKHLLVKNEPKKVQLSFKRGGDSKLENSPHKHNSSIPRIPSSADSATLAQNMQIPRNITQINPQNATDSQNANPTKNPSDSLNLSSLQIYNNANLSPQQTNYDKNLNYIVSKAIPSDIKAEILDLYGDELGDYGLAEIDFLLNNLRDIGRITQYHINRRGYPQGAKLLNQQGKNIIEFYLYPNGDISHLRVVSSANSIILDNDMMTNIKVAFREYPRPNTKVKIRFYMSYMLH